ncbi:MAG TPA: hypothetical protein VKT82_01740 [Ktedonobacterales bacterium]|nr:hypothetical protein [Ktedonobacterales bacterium]
MQKWEYTGMIVAWVPDDEEGDWLVQSVKGEHVEGDSSERQPQKYFNALGQEGWELVDRTAITVKGTTTFLTYLFKRPIE